MTLCRLWLSCIDVLLVIRLAFFFAASPANLVAHIESVFLAFHMSLAFSYQTGFASDTVEFSS